MKDLERYRTLCLTSAFLACTGVILAQGPVISPLYSMPGSIAIGPSASDQQFPSVSRGGNIFLAVWQDRRAGDSGSDIFAVRLDASGHQIDATSIAISQDAADQTGPKVAWNGQHWLIVWASQEPTESFWSSQLRAVRMSRDGAILDPVPLTLTALASDSVNFTVASDGDNWFVAYQGNSAADAGLRGVRVSAAGAVLDPPTRILLPDSTFARFNLDLAFAGNQYLLTWDEFTSITTSEDILGMRFASDLRRVDAEPFSIAALGGSQQGGRVASNGTDFFVVWQNGTSIQSTRVTRRAQVTDPGGVAIATSAAFAPRPAVSWDGQQWSVAWEDQNAIKAARVDASGHVLDQGGVVVDNVRASIKSNINMAPMPNGGAVLVWQDNRQLSVDIFATTFNGAATPGPSESISTSTPSVQQTRFATDGNKFMAATLSFVSGTATVSVQPLTSTGAAAGNPASLASGNLANAGIAFNGTVYLVVWTDLSTTQIFARRVSPTGTPLDAAPFIVMPGLESDVAANSGLFLVTGSNAPTNPEIREIFAARVNGSGTVLDAPLRVGGNFSFTPRAGVLGNGWLVVFSSASTHDSPFSVVNGTIVKPDGSFQPPIQIEGPGSLHHDLPAVAGNQSMALVVWQDSRDGNNNIYGARVTATGALPDGVGVRLTDFANDETNPAIVWNGSAFIVAWEDRRTNTFFLDTRSDVFAARVTPGMQILDPSGFAIANSSLAEQSPAGVVAGNGMALISAQTFVAAQPFGAFRTKFRFVNATGKLPVAVPNADNLSGDAPLSVSFTAAASLDPDGQISHYRWDFGDGSSADSATVLHVYAQPGTYRANLTVTDNSGRTNTAPLVVTVLAPVPPGGPVVTAKANPASGFVPLTVNFSSVLQSGSVSTYLWDFGDGTTSTLPAPSHIYSAAGIYDTLLTATDAAGDTGSSVVSVTVQGTMRSTNIALQLQPVGGNGLIGNAAITVKDQSGRPIPSAQVNITWDVPPFVVSQTAQTNADGVAVFTMNTSAMHATFTITINDIIKAGYVFDRAHSVLTKTVSH